MLTAEGRALLWAALLILSVLVLGNWRLLTDHAAPQWDAADFFGPAFSLVADHVKAGRLLLWNPWIGGGNPDFAEPELGTTSPLMLFVGLLSPNPQAGFIAYWLAFWFLGGCGMLFLARSLGAPVWAAVTIALAFITSGLYTGHAEHTSSLYSASMLPWIFWRFSQAVRRENYWIGLQAGAFYGLSALGGYPEFTILTALLLALWAAGAVAFENRKLKPVLIALLLTIGVGAIIFSPNYVSIVEATRGFSDRVGPRPRIEAVSSNSMTPGALQTFANPYLALLNSGPHALWPQTDISMTSIYLMPIVLGFAVLAWLKSSAWRWWLLAITILFLLCTVGDHLPVRGWLYDYVWPTRYFRNPALFRAYVIFLVCAVAAYGANDLAAALSRVQRLWTVASILVSAACLVCFWRLSVEANVAAENHSLALFQLLLLAVAVPSVALLLQLQRVSLKTVAVAIVLLTGFDAIATLRISEPTMYSSAMLPWWHTENARHVRSVNLGALGIPRQFNPPDDVGAYANNRNIPLRIPTLNSYIPLSNRFAAKIAANKDLAAMALGKNRFWFSAQPAFLPPTDENFDLFAQRISASGHPFLVLQTRAQMLQATPANTIPVITELATAVPASIEAISYGPNALSFTFNAERSGWLMITDRWSRDWQATVNNKPMEVLGGNFVFRAIPVEVGQNRIAFRYRVPCFIFLTILSWLVLLAIGLCSAVRPQIR